MHVPLCGEVSPFSPSVPVAAHACSFSLAHVLRNCYLNSTCFSSLFLKSAFLISCHYLLLWIDFTHLHQQDGGRESAVSEGSGIQVKTHSCIDPQETQVNLTELSPQHTAGLTLYTSGESISRKKGAELFSA